MVLSREEIQRITTFVKKEPHTIQDIARFIGKSWVTAESYVQKIQDQTGLVRMKVFRDGTKGALKLVFWNYGEALEHDELKKYLWEHIRLGRVKRDFDPFDIYQHISKKEKRVHVEIYEPGNSRRSSDLVTLFQHAEQEIHCFSGNNSWLIASHKDPKRGTPLLQVVESALQRNVSLRIVSRVDISALENFHQLERLMNKYPQLLEIKHVVQPLRGFIIDGKLAQLKDEKEMSVYKKGELRQNLRVFYQWTDPEWVFWMEQVFWNLYRNAPLASQRLEELERLF